MQEFINMLSPHLEYVSMHSSADCIVFEVRSKTEHPVCPYCGKPSHRCHSRYRKSFQDLPVHGRNVMIEMISRKMFCDNPDCSHRTFAETFDFIDRSQKKTKRLIHYITDTANHMSSVSAQNTLRKSGIRVGKSSICCFLKNNWIGYTKLDSSLKNCPI